MQIKEINPINFLYFGTDATSPEFPGFVRRISQALYLDAAKQGIEVTGPVYWHYFDHGSKQPSPLEISIPIAECPANYQGNFKLKRTSVYKCLSTFHYGNRLDIPKTYRKLREYSVSHQLSTLFMNREIYINNDFFNPENSVIEIQMGIQ